MSRTAAVLLSGGIDSAACAHLLKARGNQVTGFFIDYGQRAAKPEREAADSLTRTIGIPLEALTLRGRLSSGQGEILGRNAFLVLSVLCLGRITSGLIALGIHSGTRYYDCSPQFHSLMDRLVAEYTDGVVRVEAPFLSWSKKEIFTYYRDSGLPIAAAYSCESGTRPPCGECLSCRDRRDLGCLT